MTETERRTRTPKPAAPATPPVREEFAGQEAVLGSMYPQSVKLGSPGDMFTLLVTDFGVEQDRDYDTGDPLFWDDGRPKNVAVVVGLIDDDTEASWWVRGKRATAALRNACKAVGIRGLAKGDSVTVVRGDDETVPPKDGKGKAVVASTFEVTVTPAGTAG